MELRFIELRHSTISVKLLSIDPVPPIMPLTPNSPFPPLSRTSFTHLNSNSHFNLLVRAPRTPIIFLTKSINQLTLTAPFSPPATARTLLHLLKSWLIDSFYVDIPPLLSTLPLSGNALYTVLQHHPLTTAQTNPPFVPSPPACSSNTPSS